MQRFDENDLIDLAYEAATDPGLWTRLMERFADLLHADGALLSQFDLVTGEGGGIIARVDPAMPTVYRRDFADKNILNNVSDLDDYLSNWSPSVMTDEDWIPKEDLVRSDYYNGFLKPQDIHSVLMIRLTLKHRRLNALNIHRGAAAEQFGGRDLEVVARVQPHLIRALKLGETIAARDALFADAGDRFDASANALYLIDGDSRVLRANRIGESLAASGEGPTIRAGRLTASSPAESRRLEALVRAAASPDPDLRRGGSMMFARGECGLPLAVTVTPLKPQRGILGAAARVLVCVLNMEGEIAFPAALMTELFGLTSAEARVASLLFAGTRPKDAAEQLRVSGHTIHVHIAHLFEKTGVRRQSELVRLMMRLSVSGTPQTH
jgi:DNA-binding CsgD family transcriptional regulator